MRRGAPSPLGGVGPPSGGANLSPSQQLDHGACRPTVSRDARHRRFKYTPRSRDDLLHLLPSDRLEGHLHAAEHLVRPIARMAPAHVANERGAGWARRIRMGTICSPSAPVRDLVPLLAIPSGETVGALDLPRRARHRTVGTEDATVACLWPQNSLAAAALVEEHAGIGRHLERLGVPAFRAA